MDLITHQGSQVAVGNSGHRPLAVLGGPLRGAFLSLARRWPGATPAGNAARVDLLLVTPDNTRSHLLGSFPVPPGGRCPENPVGRCAFEFGSFAQASLSPDRKHLLVALDFEDGSHHSETQHRRRAYPLPEGFLLPHPEATSPDRHHPAP